MANTLPSNVLRLDLRDEITSHFPTLETKRDPPRDDSRRPPSSQPPRESSSSSSSLLAPLRRQKNGRNENVSTVEATVVALVGLGMERDDADRILDIARTKVNRLMRYAGKTHR